jgi:hypothetical protein
VALDLATPHLPAAHTDQPPVIDGNLDDAAWKAATASDAFTQQYPFDRQPPSEHTTLRVLYDADAIYIGFDCDQVRTPIVERLTRRDRDSESEWVWVQIDSRNDRKNAFIFAVNISGVLADGQILNQSVTSFEWDENWEAKTARTSHGWSAEIRIPLRVLRFDGKAPVQSWGLQAARFIAERQELDLWAYFPRDVASPVTFFGRLEDLRNLQGGGAVELRPFVLGFGRRRQPSTEILASGYDASASAGLDLKWHAGQDLTLDAALLPDFAQVEADQVILNLSNYETFLPEKRPLFLEGAEAFSFPIQVFYSRRVGAAPLPPSLPVDKSDAPLRQLVDVPTAAPIYGAAKLVGRLSPAWTIGALSAVTARNDVVIYDPSPMAMSPRASEQVAPLTAFNVLRLKRELGGAGHIGIIGTGSTAFESGGGNYPTVPATTTTPAQQLCPVGEAVNVGARCFHDSYVAGADALWRSPSGDYVASGAFVQSWIRNGPPRTLLDGTQVGPGDYAPGGWLRLAKEGGKHVLASLEYTGAGRKLDYNDVGYMPRQNLQEVKAALGYRNLQASERTIDTQFGLEVSERRNLDGLDLGQLYELNARVHFRNFWMVSAAADFQPLRFDDREVGDGHALERGAWWGWKLELSTDPRGLAAVSLANQTQVISGGAYACSAQGSLLLHVLPQFDLELLPSITWSNGEFRYAFNVSSDGDAWYGRLLARSVSATLRASYTFTPQLSLNVYAQAFLAAGNYTDLHDVGDPMSKQVLRSAIAVAPGPGPGANLMPDFEEAALNANVVLRWEYRLGSTLSLVYSRSQVPAVAAPTGAIGLDFRALGQRASADVVLFKLTYWWSS